MQEIGRDAFATVKAAKSFVYDNIFSSFRRLVLLFNENLLGFLYNTSFETTCFPNSWKAAMVATIFTDRGKTEKSMYQLSLALHVTPVLFENQISNQVSRYTKDKDTFHMASLGFARSFNKNMFTQKH